MNTVRGFSLLEVMVAVFIFALATAGFFKVLGESARHAEYLEARYFAGLYAHNQLVELQLADSPPATGSTSGDGDLAGRRYHWIRTVENTANDGIRRINLVVESESGKTLSELSMFLGGEP